MLQYRYSRGHQLLSFPALRVLQGILEHAQVEALVCRQERQRLPTDDKLCCRDIGIVKVLGQQCQLLTLHSTTAVNVVLGV